MPGSIQVSVIGLIGLPSPPPLSSLSLTVTVGKMEYQTVGDGQLSVPVLSLRENPIVMVHNAEGEEILRTEFRTVLLMERGLLDDLYPLKNGGSLRIKLQFSLGEKDRKRVLEMRESALKRRGMEKPNIKHKMSFPDNRIGCSATRAIEEIASKGMLLNHSERTEPFWTEEKISSTMIEIKDFPGSTVIEEEGMKNLTSTKTISNSLSAGILSEIISPGKPKFEEEPFLLEKKTQIILPSVHFEAQGNKDTNFDVEDIKSSKIVSSDEDSHYVNSSNSRRSLDLDVSVRASSERKDLESVDDEKASSEISIITSFETDREKESLNIYLEKGGDFASKKTLIARPFTNDGNDISSEQVNEKINTVNAGENNDELEKKMLDEQDGNEIFSEEIDEKIDAANAGENNYELEKKMLDEQDGNEISSEQVDEKIDVVNAGENNDELEKKMLDGQDGNEISSEQVYEKIDTFNADENNDELEKKMLDEQDRNEISSEQVYEKIDTVNADENNYELEKKMLDEQDGNEISSEQVTEKIDTVNADENNDELEKKMLDELLIIEHFFWSESLEGDDKTISDSITSMNRSIEIDRQNRSKIHEDANSSEEIDRKAETIVIIENNNEERKLGVKSSLQNMVIELEKIEQSYQQGSSVEVAETMIDENALWRPSNEQAVHGSSYEKDEALNCGFREVFMIGILAERSLPHLCITTGSKILRNFAEICAVSLETNFIESSSMREADSEQHRDGDACLQGIASMVLPSSEISCVAKGPTSLDSNRGLLEQGVRIIAAMVACGLLLNCI